MVCINSETFVRDGWSLNLESQPKDVRLRIRHQDHTVLFPKLTEEEEILARENSSNRWAIAAAYLQAASPFDRISEV